MKDHILKLRQDAVNNLQKATQLEHLLVRFPDLERSVNRWNHEKFCSSLVNPIAEQCYIHHNCGCCEDSPVEVEPFIEINDIIIHSKPYSVMVGQKKSYSYGDEPWGDWESLLTNHGFSDKILDEVRKHFQAYRFEEENIEGTEEFNED